ncbi:MAG: O-antigen ligase family protein [bacterium]|nr:O-antigen ligase family protein [bacterium]
MKSTFSFCASTKVKFFNILERTIFYLILLFIPVQLGKHFWIQSSYIHGIRSDYLSPTLYATDLLIGILIIVWIYSKKNKFSILEVIRLNWLTAFFLISILFFSVLFSKDKIIALYGLIKFFEFFFFGYFVSQNVKKENLKKIVSIFSISVIFVSIIAILQYLNQASLGGFLYFLGERSFTSQTPGIANASINGELLLRPYATFPHPNVLAGYLTIALAMVISTPIISGSNLKKYFYLISLIVGSIALVLTMSRIPILFWSIIVFFYFFLNFTKKKSSQMLFFLLITVLGFFTFLLFSPAFLRFVSASINDDSVQTRLTLINTSVLSIKDNPVFGVGLNNYLQTFNQYQKPTESVFMLQPVHNIFLLVAVQTGLTGLIVFLLFIKKTYIRIRDQGSGIKNFKTTSLLILSTTLILGFFDHYFLTLQQGQLLFSFIFGICWVNWNKR